MNNTDKKTVNPRLHKGSSGTYEIRWSDGKRSRRKSTGTDQPKEAYEAFSKFITSGAEAERKAKNPTFGDLLNDYLKQHVERNLASAPSYSRQVDCLNTLSACFADLPVSLLSPALIAEYQVMRSLGRYGKRKATASTVRRELGVLIAALNHAKRNRTIAEVPYIRLPQESKPRDLWLTQEELEQFLQAAVHIGGRVRTFIEVAAFTASRKDAVMRLLWRNVNIADGVINFQDIDLPITKKRRVPVPMSRRLRAYLSELYDRKGHPKDDELLLGTSSSIRRDFDRVCAHAHKVTGNPKFLEVTPHVLRHTWATLAAKNRVPVFEIAGVLGDNVQTVTRVYAKHHPDHLRGAVGFMDGAPA